MFRNKFIVTYFENWKFDFLSTINVYFIPEKSLLNIYIYLSCPPIPKNILLFMFSFGEKTIFLCYLVQYHSYVKENWEVTRNTGMTCCFLRIEQERMKKETIIIHPILFLQDRKFLRYIGRKLVLKYIGIFNICEPLKLCPCKNTIRCTTQSD